MRKSWAKLKLREENVTKVVKLVEFDNGMSFSFDLHDLKRPSVTPHPNFQNDASAEFSCVDTLFRSRLESRCTSFLQSTFPAGLFGCKEFQSSPFS